MKRTTRPWLALSLLLLAVIIQPSPKARSQDLPTFTTLYRFTGGNDGSQPATALRQGSDGSFYGTTARGGTEDRGTIFKTTPDGVLTTLHNFKRDNSDGNTPLGALVQGNDGNFYGTTARGGSDVNAVGSVFKITPAGDFTTLFNFLRTQSDAAPNGNFPNGLTAGSDGNFYGTTQNEGVTPDGKRGQGTFFRVTPGGVLTTLHVFTQPDGLTPVTSVIQGRDGNFYGTTSAPFGTVYKITPDGMLAVLHAFSNDGEGAHPHGALVQGSGGEFYGTTSKSADAAGTVFKVTPDGTFTNVFTFTTVANVGPSPEAALILGNNGNIYGTTADGGTNRAGTIFEITPAGVLTTIFTFNGDSDGGTPNGLVQGNDGNLYGTTSRPITGATAVTYGTVFRLTLPSGTSHAPFFNGEAALGNGVYYLQFPGGNPFGYYSFLADPHYIFHQDLGYEYVFDAQDGKSGVYLYDFKSQGFFYTSPSFPFPYLYDLSSNTVLYYFPDPVNPGRYNTNGVRYFVRLDTGEIISK